MRLDGSLPLEGLKVIDVSTMMAAPWAATYLADFGAEVIKVEHPQFGDHVRRFGAQKDGISLFWKTISRNKKSITLDLSTPQGQELFKRLVRDCDVLIENFRPGTLERWKIGWEELSAINSRLIMLRTTGFGQTGPYARRAGFGTVAEAMSGFAYITGHPDGPPTLPSIPLADGVCSVFGALSVMIAVYERDVRGSGKGQYIDICLYEPLFRFLESQVVEYDQLGIVHQRLGNRTAEAAPRNAYVTRDGKWVALSASAQPIAERVFKAIGREELISDERFKDNASRLKHSDELDEIIGSWIANHGLEEVLETFEAAGAVVGPVYNMEQIFEDPHFKERGTIIEVADPDFGRIRMPNVVARFSRTPGEIKHPGPRKGEHNQEIFGERLGLSPAQVEELKRQGVI